MDKTRMAASDQSPGNFKECKISTKQLASLKRLHGLLSATPDEMLSLHTTRSPRFLGLEPEKGLWSPSNLKSDVIIGVVDSRIWPEHISFDDEGMPPLPTRWKGVCEEDTKFSQSNCNRKIIGARAFFQDYEAAVGRINKTEEYRSARDAEGHGTHTASTTAGNLVANASIFGLAKGLAGGLRYTSRIAAYKACWSEGCVSSDVLAAIDQAIANGVDVLPLSLGGSAQPYYRDNIAIAGDILASYCVDGSLKKKIVKRKIVVCQGGIDSRAEKGEEVKLAGGAGMLIINTEREGDELFADAHILPATSLGDTVRKAIKEYINSTKKSTAAFTFKGTVYGKPAPLMAAFSSRGPNEVGPDLIKPDVTAPGMNILAAWPPLTSPTQLKSDKRSVLFNVVSGTSMSCPHVSGLAALLKSVHKDWSPAAIKFALMITAYVHDNTDRKIIDIAFTNTIMATPFAFGSGHVNLEKASDPGLIYDIAPEDYQNYLCTLNYSASQITLFAGKDFTFQSFKHASWRPKLPFICSEFQMKQQNKQCNLQKDRHPCRDPRCYIHSTK
ncbi:Subtilisin-like protease SBT1.1 [Hibiscus syriacus]|uniref:Subtilisin-like protease SBT1.1 n=1 Tax=Hibiscus syriacus TaxID=106335 RepID=A0A6A3A9F7_HIBSY|nr:Subtilisin-like protease SBT1.1 [Hibiscus syriacus]